MEKFFGMFFKNSCLLAPVYRLHVTTYFTSKGWDDVGTTYLCTAVATGSIFR